MIRARLSDGRFLLGIDANNVQKMKEGKPLVVDLSDHGGVDCFIMVYGDTLADVLKDITDAGFNLPPAQPMPTKGRPS